MDDYDLTEIERQLMEMDLDIENFNPDEYLGEPKTFPFMNTFKQCFWPTSSQTIGIVGPLVGLCLIVRAISILPVPRWLVHLSSLVTGCVAMHLFMEHFVGYPVVMCMLGYFILSLPVVYKGAFMSFMCLVYILTCELFIATSDSWHKVRGTQMILSMKIISIAFDIDQGVVSKKPNPLEYLGYSLNAGSIIFGPFMSYDNYLCILDGKRLLTVACTHKIHNTVLSAKNKMVHSDKRYKTFSWLFGVLRSGVLSYVCLIHSVCIAPYIFYETSHKWLLAYQLAMSFRFSNYFVSYLSECTSLASGVYTEIKDKDHVIAKWQYDISRPYHVELPRSLVEVVIHWNIPNHVFLKNYVFKKARSLGRFTAIFLTFGCSALLHGLNVQLAAVLLSIGMYAYIEHTLRARLAGFFSACIAARKCRPECGHRCKEGEFWVMATNLALSFLSVFHLAYLGIMFGGDASEQEQGMDASYTLKKWHELDFASHWVALSSFFIAQCIPKPQAS